MFLEFLGSYREFQAWKYLTYMNRLSVSIFFLHLGPPSQCRTEGQGQARDCARCDRGLGHSGDKGLGHQCGTAARAAAQLGTTLWPCVGTRTG